MKCITINIETFSVVCNAIFISLYFDLAPIMALSPSSARDSTCVLQLHFISVLTTNFCLPPILRHFLFAYVLLMRFFAFSIITRVFFEQLEIRCCCPLLYIADCFISKIISFLLSPTDFDKTNLSCC